MPEGDTVWLTAHNLDAALRGASLTRCDIRVPAYATVDLTGDTVHQIASRGKHLLIRVGESSIHSHLKMEGAWHLYRHGTPWRRPAFQARAVLETVDWVAVGFELGVLEVLPAAREAATLEYLGPDLLGVDWDAGEAVRRIGSRPERPIAVALADQANLAGLGNEYVNELCFLRGLLPTRPVAAVADVPGLVDLAHRLIFANRARTDRITTGSSRRGEQAWVYGRAGKPCRRCGTRIERGSLGRGELEQRVTFWCPRCQS
jgi:formamidopyrimidine-DNA glycosylase